MTHRTATTWKCDRCKVEDEVDYVKQPDGWSSIRLHMPPNHAEEKARLDLCKSCESALADFLYPDMAGSG
jgi:hypothetical protein